MAAASTHSAIWGARCLFCLWVKFSVHLFLVQHLAYYFKDSQQLDIQQSQQSQAIA